MCIRDRLMPAPIYYAHKLALKLRDIHKKYDELGPDGKTQVTVRYIDNVVNSIDSIVISTQHSPNIAVSYTHLDVYKRQLHNLPNVIMDLPIQY